MTQDLLYGYLAACPDTLAELGLNLDDFVAQDIEPGLGNGGLGRLAACFIDSLAALDNSATGYGWLKDLGQFRQLESFQDDAEFMHPWRAIKPRTFIFGAKAAPGYYMGQLDDQVH